MSSATSKIAATGEVSITDAKIPKYQMVTTKAALLKVLKRCKARGPTALDFETTSLRPTDGRVRLVSLCTTGVRALVDFDRIKGGFRGTAHLFDGGTWVVFNKGFELRWFLDAGCSPEIYDLDYIRKAILGGGGISLAKLLLWDLGVRLHKEEQLSDWGAKKLTKKQLNYAYGDAHYTWKGWLYWTGRADPEHWGAFHMLNDMVPAVIEMEDRGILLDPPVHQQLVHDWEAVKVARVEEIRKMVTPAEVANLNSDVQWSDYFARIMPDDFLAGWPRTEKTGQLSMKGEILRNLAGTVPGTPLETFFDLLADYKKIAKYLSSFGETLITKAAANELGRILARYNIGRAKTLRFSSSGPNVQQIPRDRDLLGTATSVRASFIAPRGRRLVSLDYSGIEMRVLALLSGDEQLLEDVVEGDVHSEVAAVIAGAPIDRSTKAGYAARTAAKAVSFGIIFGSGPTGLAVTMRTSVGRAQSYIDFWANRYPKAFGYRNLMMDEAQLTRYIRCVDGGTIYMGRKPEMPKCANYPVQRAALSVMAKAITRHKGTLDLVRSKGKQRHTFMLATIHDALIDEATTRDARACLRHMEHDMTQGYLDIFPGAPTASLVEGGIGINWGALD